MKSAKDLDQAWKTLFHRWTSSQAHWDDDTRRQFERELWQILQETTVETVEGMSNLGKVLAQARAGVD